MQQPQYIFNRHLLRLRHLKSPYKETQLHRFVSQSIADRLSYVRRFFNRVLVIGDFKVDGFAQCQDAHIVYLNWGGDACDVVGDSEFLPFAPQSFDLIISVFDVHTANDVPGVLLQARQALQPDGLLLCAFLGGRTLEELCHATMMAEEQLRGGITPRVAPMISLADAASLLQRAGFALPVADHDKLHLSFETPAQLLALLKTPSLSNLQHLQHQGLVTKAFIQRVSDIYTELYGTSSDVTATIDLVFLSGWAPSSRQQQALKPGSAEYSLSDFLNTV